ncbi:MAG: CocE/NonD family hydrolase [Caulobacteraceae bacterium]|nr:CocE/NonD family hydrolase [Caulobacteraceae bacterium]
MALGVGLCLGAPGPAAVAAAVAPKPPAPVSPYSYQQVMIPMRDGARLQTVIMAPADQTVPLPILLRRTPYGVPDKPPLKTPSDLEALAKDGYIFVVQNLRGRFKSEGSFLLTSAVDLKDRRAVNEATDAWDTIDWLVKHVPNTNGRVGIYGVSYDGMTAAQTLLLPHPALKAVSEQASPADQWMNDDDHRYGAFRLSPTFEYGVMEQAKKTANTHIRFETYDAYQWYLELGPLSNINAKYLHGGIPHWNNAVDHPDYDAYWKREAWVDQLRSAPVPTLNVAGFWDQEDPWGPWRIFANAGQGAAANFMVAGPWCHGCWRQPKGDTLAYQSLGGHETSREFRETIEAPFFRAYLHGDEAAGAKPPFDWRVSTFQTGANQWRTYAEWPPKAAMATSLYLHLDGSLSFDPPSADEVASAGASYRQYVSDPANPVPYRQRPISPVYPGGDWRTWESADQRFVDHRPDVLTFVSAPLTQDLTVTGALAAQLFASTSGTDSDFIVKLIDVYPEDGETAAWDVGTGPAPGQYAQSMNGYQLPIAMEIRRGRYNQSYEHPAPLVPNQPSAWDIPLRDHDHVFLKGHRLMVQIQSSWFPLYDRNPQTFVASIYKAAASDFVPATQRIYAAPGLASRIVLPVVK